MNAFFEESLQDINDLLEEAGESPITEYVARKEWHIEGGESYKDIQQMVNDYISELDTERAAARHYPDSPGYWESLD